MVRRLGCYFLEVVCYALLLLPLQRGEGLIQVRFFISRYPCKIFQKCGFLDDISNFFHP